MEYPETARNVTGTHEKRRCWRGAVSVLACVVVFCTTYALILPAITLSAEPKCGLEEHTHTEDCYETRLVCGQEEAPETNPAGSQEAAEPAGSQEAAEPAHVHTDACYERVLTCEKPEHTHTDACYADPAAAEDPKDWEPQDLTGDWNRDTLTIALAQEGYRPSESCFTMDDAGEHIGYTRYGDWNGDPFGEWNLSFAAFCLHYAGAAAEAFPVETGAEAWHAALDALELYQPLEGAVPGDLIFLDSDGDGEADRVGIFTGWQDAGPETAETARPEASSGSETSAGPEQRFAVMEGDLDGEAAQALYDPEDAALLGRASPDEAADAWYLCGEKAHIHGDDCYDGTGALTCGKTEHIHSEDCQLPESRSFTWEDDDLSLTVTVLTPDPLPEDTELTVTEASEATLQEAETYADENDAALLAARRLTLQQGDGPIDTTDFRMTAEVQVREELLDQLRQQAATFAADAPEAEAAITISALQPQEEDLARQASVQVEPGENPMLSLTLRSDEVVVVASSEVNPRFTVQYYAELPMLANSGGSKTLPVFDTTGIGTPKNYSLSENATKNKKKNLQLQTEGSSYEVLTTTELRQLYRTETMDFTTHPSLVNVNKLNGSSNYTLKKVLVRWDGKTANPTDDGWTEKKSDVQFTNDPKAGGNTICITSDTVLCLVYEPKSGSYTNSTTFYDYDITDGNTGNLNSQQKGINSASNYSGNGEKFAFGNANCGTGMDGYQRDGYYMNQYSKPGYSDDKAPMANYGCNFGLVTGLDANGKLKYADGVIAPNLFNDGSAVGKYTYEGSGLTFNREGDIYTLFSATLNNGQSISNLNQFSHPSGYNWKDVLTRYDHIFTNNFWPMDGTTNRKDPNFGHGMKGERLTVNNGSTVLPASDDNTNHNSFFGMQFALQFTLTEDYTGPLEYLFFGDDDMWVFLDGKLICDIGGVHSSVGEYVDLWNYLKQGKAGTHTLTFFYTERGASGSTCYMRFILPSVSEIPVQQVGGLRIEKQVEGLGGDLNQDFNFAINLKNAKGDALNNQYSYRKYDKNGNVVTAGTIRNDDIFQLKSGQYLIITDLPYGSQYVITETEVSGYTTTNVVNGVVSDTGNAAGAFIQGATNTVLFLNAVNPVDLDIQKAASEDETKPLAGAQFELSQDGKTLSFTKKSDGTYTVENADYPRFDEDREYYIVLESNEDWGIGRNSEGGNNAGLQSGDSRKAFKVKRQSDDGSYGFVTKVDGKDYWLNLKGNEDAAQGKAVLIYPDDGKSPNRNERWYLLGNGDGSFRIKAKLAVMWGTNTVLDLSNATTATNQPIQMWENNGTTAQQWKLIPVTPTVTTQTLTTDANNGKLHIDGLTPGTYTLTETQAPDNYQQLTKPITITVYRDGRITLGDGTPADAAKVTTDGNDVLLTVLNNPNTVDLTLKKEVVGLTGVTRKFPFTITYTIPGGEEVTKSCELAHDGRETITGIPYGATVTITETAHDGFSVLFKEGKAPLEANGDSCTFTITSNVTITAENHTGYQLPSTGGMGTGWFTLAGLLLMTGAAALTISRRRAKEGGPE